MRDGGFEMKATGDGNCDDFIVVRRKNGGKLADAFRVAALGQADKELPSDAKDTVNYSFRVGFQFRHRPTKFDSAGACRHIVAEDNGDEVRLRCGVDCDGGGIEVAMKDDKSAVVRTERIRIWKHKHPDDEDTDDARLGDDDKTYRLDRVDTRECADLADDRKEVAALRHK